MKNEFVTEISYARLRQIIVDYFKKIENIELCYASIEYFQDMLRETGKYSYTLLPYFSMSNGLGESKFDIPREDIFKILSLYVSSMGFELVNVEYKNKVQVTYRFLKLVENSIIENTNNNNNNNNIVKSK